MCTSFTYYNNDFYLGRNLDLDCGFGEEVVITPREYRFQFRHEPTIEKHSAMIGMATIVEGYPLYAEAINEHGLGICGLEFKGNAKYFDLMDGKDNIAPFEIIPWILSNCVTAKEARSYFEKMNIIDEDFAPNLPLSPLHWLIADKDDCFVVESTKDGLMIYDNIFGTLTNNPPFPYHLSNMMNYLNLTPKYPENRFSKRLDLEPFANGMGALGLPGDASSPSRFVKTVFLKENMTSSGTEEVNVQQYFRVLNQVSMIKGSVITKENREDYTVYSACMNATKGIYYYQTYENMHINSVCMHDENLDSSVLIVYKLDKTINFLKSNSKA